MPRHEIAVERERIGEDARDAAHDGEHSAAAASQQTFVDVRRV
jgi:hypothetical protein